MAVPAYDCFASRDQLNRMAVERMLARLSIRRYTSGLEPVGSGVEAEATGTSKSAVSRRFVSMARKALEELMARRLDELDLLVLMIDGVQVAEHLCVVALGIDAEGRKHPPGLIEGATENGTVVTHLLEDLVSRGLDASRGLLVVIDGSRAPAAAVRTDVPHPINWRTLTAEDAEYGWLALNEWVDWLRHEFGLPASIIPPAWHLHPELVGELSALHLHWLGAYAPAQHAPAPIGGSPTSTPPKAAYGNGSRPAAPAWTVTGRLDRPPGPASKSHPLRRRQRSSTATRSSSRSWSPT